MLIFAALLMTSCVKQNTLEEPFDRWNGYGRYLKMGEQTHILWAGKHINAGTATYGIDNNANFYVTYDCSSTDWSIKETHLFAGDKKYLPKNRCAQPRVNRFPYSAVHQPRVKTYTYRIPLVSLPPAEEPGFAVAAQCVVYRSTKCDGHEKVAWAEGDFKFSDKGLGWYDVFYYNQIANQFTILYGLSYANDSLRLYHLDVTNGTVDLTFTEYVGNSAGAYDGAAYDIESGILFFVKVNTHELWLNDLDDEDSSFMAGSLSGDVFSAAYQDGLLYYVDADMNTIHGITFNNDWSMNSDILLDTIPNSINVNDIAMAPDGEHLFILGDVNSGGTELISWDLATETFCSMSVEINNGAQIAFGNDGVLYAIVPGENTGEYSFAYSIDTESGVLLPIEDSVIMIEDPFSDLSGGPAQ